MTWDGDLLSRLVVSATYYLVFWESRSGSSTSIRTCSEFGTINSRKYGLLNWFSIYSRVKLSTVDSLGLPIVRQGMFFLIEGTEEAALGLVTTWTQVPSKCGSRPFDVQTASSFVTGSSVENLMPTFSSLSYSSNSIDSLSTFSGSVSSTAMGSGTIAVISSIEM